MNIREHVRVGATGIITYLVASLVAAFLTIIIPHPRYWPTLLQQNVNLISMIFVYSISAIISVHYLRPISKMNCFSIGFYPAIYSLYQSYRPWPFIDYNLVNEVVPQILAGYIASIIISLKLKSNKNSDIKY